MTGLLNDPLGEFLHETYRYGNPPPTLKLGLLRYPDAAHVVDLGLSDKHRISGVRGRAGHAYADSATGELLAIIEDPDTGMGYDSLRKYYDDQKKKGRIREGLSFDDWKKTVKALSEDERYVVMPAQAKDPLMPNVWSHEFAHLGQFDTPESGSGKEARQRMRDIMYPSLRHPEEIEKDLQWLEDSGYEIGGKDWMQLYENTKLEDEYAAKVLEDDWKKAGKKGKPPATGTPNLQVLQDWLEGGRNIDGYKAVILQRRKENLPGLLGWWHTALGIKDDLIKALD